MHPKRIFCDVSYASESARGHSGLSETYDESRSVEDYLKYFTNQVKESHPDAHTINLERIWLTKHDSEGKYMIRENGVVEKEVIWESHD